MNAVQKGHICIHIRLAKQASINITLPPLPHGRRGRALILLDANDVYTCACGGGTFRLRPPPSLMMLAGQPERRRSGGGWGWAHNLQAKKTAGICLGSAGVSAPRGLWPFISRLAALPRI